MALLWQSIDFTDDDEDWTRRDPAARYSVPELADLLDRPAWHQWAACRGMGAGAFFTVRGEDVGPAKAICSSCPVRGECLGDVLSLSALNDGGGIWGGTSDRERRQLCHTGVSVEW